VAIQDQGQGQLQEFGGVLKRRAAAILLPALLGLAIGIALARLLPPKYSTKTGLELRESTLPIGGEGFDSHTLQRDVGSATWQIKSVERVKRVIEKLEWADYTALTPPNQHEYLRRVIENLSVNPQPAKNGQGSSYIDITYTDSDPRRAEQFLNRLREAYTTEVVERVRADARAALDILSNTQKIEKNKYLEADREAAEIKKLNNVSATQQAPGGGRQRDEDPVFVHLTATQTRLDDLDTQIATIEATLATLKQQYADTPREISRSELQPAVSYDQEIDDIDSQIADLRDSQSGLRPANSVYQEAEIMILKLQGKRELLRTRATKPLADVGTVHNPRRDELETEMQKNELALKTNQGLRVKLAADLAALGKEQEKRVEIFREIQRLDHEAEIALTSYAAASNAFDRQKRFVDLITQSSANPYEVTEQARTPLKPTSPNQPLVIIGGLLAGLSIGLLSAFAAEYGHNAFRGVADVSRTLSVPVLGIVNRIVTRRDTSRERARRLTVIASTCILAAALLWVTWAFENSPRLLGPSLTHSIESFREVFR
jgi:uncharacterized protein involved in exopolysaccharide biosynthesis